MRKNYFLIILISIFVFNSLFVQLIADSLTIEDDAFVAFVKGPDNFKQFFEHKQVTDSQSKELLARIYGTHLGTLYYMRKNWHCANVREELQKFFDQEECDRGQNYLDILYEYLANVYAGRDSAVKPIFVINQQNRYSFVKVVAELAETSRNTFCHPTYIFNDNVVNVKVPHLLFHLQNEEEWAHWKANLAQNSQKQRRDDEQFRAKFDEIMKKLFKKLGEKTVEHGFEKEGKLAPGNPSGPNGQAFPVNKEQCNLKNNNCFYDIIMGLPKYTMANAIEDKAFLVFVKRNKNFVKILNHIADKRKTIHDYYKECEIEDYIRKFEMNSGLLYLMRKKWHCANAKIKIGNECENFRHYLDIVYEFLFRVRFGIGAVKPAFQLSQRDSKKVGKKLVEILESLNGASALFFGKDYLNQRLPTIKLSNENELNYVTNAVVDHGEWKGNPKLALAFKYNIVQIAKESKATATEKQINPGPLEDLMLYKIFDEELEEMLEKWTKMVSEEKAELDAMNEQIKQIEENDVKNAKKEENNLKKAIHRLKFFKFLRSPFLNIQ